MIVFAGIGKYASKKQDDKYQCSDKGIDRQPDVVFEYNDTNDIEDKEKSSRTPKNCFYVTVLFHNFTDFLRLLYKMIYYTMFSKFIISHLCGNVKKNLLGTRVLALRAKISTPCVW